MLTITRLIIVLLTGYFVCFIVSAPIMLTAPTSVVGYENTRQCSLMFTEGKSVTGTDKHCMVQKVIKETDFEHAVHLHTQNASSNYNDQMYFRVSFEFRYAVESISLATDNAISDFSIVLKVSQDNYPALLTEILAVSQNDDGSFRLASHYSDWSAYTVTFQRHPGPLPTIVSIQAIDSGTVPSELVGYLEIGEISLTYLPQPGKYPLSSMIQLYAGTTSTVDTNAHSCDLLGNVNALILNNIHVDTSQHDLYSRSHDAIPIRPVKVFCGVYTTESNHHRVEIQRDTWGRKCSGFLVFSDTEDVTLPSITLPFFGVESYNNIWQKVRSILKYVHHHYIEEYDYFLLGGDDMYYLMENLYQYLNSEEITALRAEGHGLYLGREYNHYNGEVMYNTGGPGYMLDRTALKVLMRDFNRCCTRLIDSCEDVFVAHCLNVLGHIYPHNTSDALNRQRWHNFPPGYFVQPELHYDRKRIGYLERDIHFQYGRDCCSSESVAFHYLQPEMMKMIDDYVYRCPPETKQQYYDQMGQDYYDPATLMTFSEVPV